ncbi:transcriptional regulator GutM [Marinococcus halotolerans]|jgi:glucitol operon activator protein|uniref:transcriptional regulator GutM n=1 Tax=Marinococcus halotolerans TaxID=301092 RepID=UPI0003B3B236|nr:transcriptional regulator GutM [Marinococcus halotolerans]
MWGYFIAAFVVIWLIQFYLTFRQMKYYNNMIASMGRRPSGYLGTGIDKRLLGIGTVLLLVTNEAGTVIDARIMRGVTVFARFAEAPELMGESIHDLKKQWEAEGAAGKKKHPKRAHLMAAQQILAEQKRKHKKGDNKWIS